MSDYSPEQLQEALDNLDQNIMESHSVAITTAIRDKCFDICLSSAGSTLSTKDKTCIKNCSERYIDTMKLIVQSMAGQSH